MLAAILCLFVLFASWFVVRTRRAVEHEGANEADPTTPEVDGPWSHRPSRHSLGVGFALLLLAVLPILLLAPSPWNPPTVFAGDSEGHALVARRLAEDMSHGWIDVYFGGFPLGHHYPPLSWILLGATIELGAPPAAAVYTLGWLAILATPLVFFWAAIRLGARPEFAAVGAIFVSWVAPYNSFVASYETFFHTGLISQVMAAPLCAWWATSIMAGRTTYEPVLAGFLAMASHPQLAVSATIVAFIGFGVAGQRRLLVRFAWSSTALFVSGFALYAQGIGSLEVPFGWPPGFGWRQFGFDVSRIWWWLRDGDLIDRDRAPVLTSLVQAALVALLLLAPRAAPRALAATMVGTVLLSSSGRILLDIGPFGEWLTKFLQPLRMLGLIPLLGGIVVVAALEEAAPRLKRAFEQRQWFRSSRFARPVLLTLMIAIVLPALPERLGYAKSSAELFRTGLKDGDSVCEDSQQPELAHSLTELEGGSLWYGDSKPTSLVECVSFTGLSFDSSVPLATTGAVGAHVGLHAMAYNRLWPEREGSIKRARALGVGSVLHTGPPLGEGWTTIHKAGKISLAVLDAPSGIASAGCVTRQLRGNNAALSDWLVDALKTPEGVDSILDLDRLTALEITREAGLHESRPAPGCSTEDAKVTARRVRSGEVVGRVDAPSPIDLVVHVTAFPSWRVWIDGALTPTFQVAPGFVAVRVAPGSHSFRAMGGVLPSYPYVLGGAFILLAAASALLSGRLPPGPAAPPVPPPQRGWGLLTALRAKISKYRR